MMILVIVYLKRNPLYNYNLSDDYLNNLQNKEYVLSGETFKVYINPDNKLERFLVKENPSGGYSKIPLSYIHQLVASKAMRGITIENK